MDLDVQVGDRVEFVSFGEPDDRAELRPRQCGTVAHIDGDGVVHVEWDDGTKLGLLTEPLTPGVRPFRPDRFRVLARAAA